MRILAIRGRNLASLPEFDVDLAGGPVGQAGIFALVGPTGSGKSTILDALCLALFQQAPRLDGAPQEGVETETFGRIASGDIRQILRRGSSVGFAEVDFKAIDGVSYRVRWGFRAPRKKGAAVQEEMSLVELPGSRVLLTESDTKERFRTRVAELVGTTYAQFTRTVLLAQGRFAEFLKAKEGERADLLERLTGTEIYADISREIFRRSKEEQETLLRLLNDRKRLQLLDDTERQGIELELGGIDKELPAAVERGASLAELQSHIERLSAVADRKSTLSRAAAQRSESVAAHDTARTASEHRLAAARAALDDSLPAMERARELDAHIESTGLLLDRSRQAYDAARKEHVAHHERIRQAAADIRAIDLEFARDEAWIQARARLAPVAEAWDRIDPFLGVLDEVDAKERRAQSELEASRQKLAQAADLLREAETRHARLSEASATRPAEELERIQAGTDEALAAVTSLRDHVRHTTEIADLRREEGSGLEELAKLQGESPAIVATEAATRSMLEAARASLSKDAEGLRTLLRRGDPCPVCGSVEHPWADDLSHLGSETLASLEAIHRSAADILEDSRNETLRCQTRLEGVRSRLAKLQARIVPIPDRKWLQEFQERGELAPEEWFRHRIDTLEAGRRKVSEELARERELTRLASEVAMQAEKRRALRHATDALEAKREEAAQEIAHWSGEIDQLFDGTAWREHREKDPEYRVSMGRHVQAFRDVQERMETTSRRRETAMVHCDLLQNELPRLEGSLAACREESSILASQAEDFRLQRAGQFGGAPWKPELERMEGELRRAATECEACREAFVASERDLAEAQGMLLRLDQESEEWTARRDLLGRKLHLTGAEGIDVSREAALARSATEALHRRRSDLQGILEQDRRARAILHDLGGEIDQVEAVADRWQKLSKEIGSADGKAFRKIAQQFTLEELLRQANRELEGLAPRYRLRSMGQSMHFAVADRESFEELRPVQTLSGGESFLVSLALALGLSRIASGAHSVETLFIDEGFGTLDSQTLADVVQALFRLQSQGRQVGIVTHVEDLKEQIPVRIEVRRVAAGKSEVVVAT